MDEAEDLAHIRRCLAGDRRAFEPLVTKYEKVLYNVAYRILNDRQDAEDVTQASFVKAYENLGSFNPEHKFFSWIYRITMNESLNAAKLRKNHEPIGAEMLGDDKSAEDLYHDQELRRNIESCLMRLKLEHRVVIILNHFQDLSYSEMSFILDIPEKTVKSRLFTARQALRDIVTKRQVYNG